MLVIIGHEVVGEDCSDISTFTSHERWLASVLEIVIEDALSEVKRCMRGEGPTLVGNHPLAELPEGVVSDGEVMLAILAVEVTLVVY